MDFVSGAVCEQCSDRVHVNQDKFGSAVIKDKQGHPILIALVCDGVSRSYRSEIASYNTVLYVLQWAASYFPHHIFDMDKVTPRVDNILRRCNRRIDVFSYQYGQGSYSCCTVSGMITDGKDMLVFNAGDSRLYEMDMQEDKLYVLTKDNKAEDGYSISMCIGAFESDQLRISYTKEAFNRNSVYFLCTDGIYRRADLKKWGNTLFTAAHRSAMEEYLRQMVQEVRTAGETDDATALVIVKKAGDSIG